MKNLIGKKADIKCKDSWADGEWGTIVGMDGEYIYIAIADERNCVLEFTRKEIKVRK